MVSVHPNEGIIKEEHVSGSAFEPFSQHLQNKGLRLERGDTTTLQVNLGLKCNQACVHCHLDASPGRKEWMSRETMEQVVVFASEQGFKTIDVTGGAPELHDYLIDFLGNLSKTGARLMLRSNLSVLCDKGDDFMTELKKYRINIVASFPSLNESQADAMRGKGIFSVSIRCLQQLNAMGYGNPDTGLSLDLVVNPSGAFFPPSQESIEKRYKRMLAQKWGITFNNVFGFANVPLGRFYKWLKKSGNYDAYIEKLAGGFNPAAIGGLMCRSLISVSWDGYLYDCDFNQAAELPLGYRKVHISQVEELPEPGMPVAVGDHCYTCTAGAGFT